MGRLKHGKKRYTNRERQMRGKHKGKRKSLNYKPKDASERKAGFFKAPGKTPKQ